LDFTILIISDEYEISLDPSQCIFSSRLWLSGSLKGFSIVLFPSAAGPYHKVGNGDKLYLPSHRVWRLKGERWGARTGSDLKHEKLSQGLMAWFGQRCRCRRKK
jgi:hypothetical protein